MKLHELFFCGALYFNIFLLAEVAKANPTKTDPAKSQTAPPKDVKVDSLDLDFEQGRQFCESQSGLFFLNLSPLTNSKTDQKRLVTCTKAKQLDVAQYKFGHGLPTRPVSEFSIWLVDVQSDASFKLNRLVYESGSDSIRFSIETKMTNGSSTFGPIFLNEEIVISPTATAKAVFELDCHLSSKCQKKLKTFETGGLTSSELQKELSKTSNPRFLEVMKEDMNRQAAVILCQSRRDRKNPLSSMSYWKLLEGTDDRLLVVCAERVTSQVQLTITGLVEIFSMIRDVQRTGVRDFKLLATIELKNNKADIHSEGDQIDIEEISNNYFKNTQIKDLPATVKTTVACAKGKCKKSSTICDIYNKKIKTNPDPQISEIDNFTKEQLKGALCL